MCKPKVTKTSILYLIKNNCICKLYFNITLFVHTQNVNV